jgi:arylsulfatase A-like enzyme
VFVFLGCLAAGFLFLKNAEDQEGLNVVFITIDAQRPDHLGCYGYSRDTSPSIDKFAASAVVFDQAIAQSSVTIYSVPSFITSTYPYGHYKMSKVFSVILNPNVWTLPAILKKRHYKTGLVTDQPLFKGKIQGLDHAFDDYILAGMNQPEKVTEKAVDWLSKNKNKKFFLWIYYLGPHGPYHLSSPYREDFLKDDFPKTGESIPMADKEGIPRFNAISETVAEDNNPKVDYYKAAYDGKIHVVDDSVGVLFQYLKDQKIDKSTIIVLLADHGEAQGEHHLYFRHGNSLYDEVIRVPLIIRYPDSRFNGTRVKDQVQLLDVTPTLVDLLGIKDRSLTKDFEGTSLKGYLLNGTQEHPDLVLSNWSFIWSARTPEWKLIFIDIPAIAKLQSERYKQDFREYYRNSYELYHLSVDPGELNNLASKEGEVFLKLKKAIDQHMAKAQEQTRLNKKIFKKEFIEAAKKTDEVLKKELKSLGYLQ